MAKVFRTYRERVGEDGKRVPLLDAKGKPVPHERWRAEIREHTGKRRTVTLVRSQAESQRQADALQAKQDAIRNGIIPAPTVASRAGLRPFEEVAAEYQAWGEAQGGRGGRPWSDENADSRRYYTAWWGKALGVKLLADLENKLSEAEKALQELAALGRAGKTLALYREGLFSFCLWCKKRRYLRENPFEFMGKFDTTPVSVRRVITLDEIGRLFAGCPTWKALLYEVSFATGFRVGELRSLEPSSLDREAQGLRLAAAVDKGRKARFQPLTLDLLDRLAAFAASGEAMRLYQENFAKARQPLKASKNVPARPLLYVPRQPSEMIRLDLEAAGIPPVTDAGKIDFHACRVAYINFVIESGADIKTAQTLARHATAHLTMNVYGRAQDERLKAAAESVGRAVAQANPANGTGTEPTFSPIPNESAIPCFAKDCAGETMVGRGGFEPP